MPDLIVILAEDLRSAQLLRHYAKLIEPDSRVRVLPFAAGRGAGDAYVRMRYATEVKAQRHPHRRSSLMVHMDADLHTVSARHQSLAEALNSEGVKPRQPHERIAIVVPKRNTETWVHGLNGVPVDETYDFKADPDRKIASHSGDKDRLVIDRLGPGAKSLFTFTRNHSPEPPSSMPSLVVSVKELRRLEP